MILTAGRERAGECPRGCSRPRPKGENMNRILVIAGGESDLLSLLRAHCDVTVISPTERGFDTDAFDALAVLGGTEAGPLQLAPPMQAAVCRMMDSGKPVFCEFLATLGRIVGRGTASTLRQRVAYRGNGRDIDGLCDGDLLDAQGNTCVKILKNVVGGTPLLTVMEYVCAHSHAHIPAEEHSEGMWALWWLTDNALISSIRVCNFHRARFAPSERWQAVIGYVISHLAGEAVEPIFPAPVLNYERVEVGRAADAREIIERGIGWIKNADVLVNGGRDGAREGLASNIDARTGKHHTIGKIRTDCTCEVAGALLFERLLAGDDEAGKMADALFGFAFDFLQVKDGVHRGMLRWSEVAWEICYQDDAARALLPLLLAQHAGVEVPHAGEVEATLDYMLRTTCTDGIRPPCTQICLMDEGYFEWARTSPNGSPCAHFNAYYHAVLLLGYLAFGREDFLDCAVRGITTMMAAYPDTVRETSETEENCRLVLPLAILYGITGDPVHYGYLERVMTALAERRHPTGGYAEWDTGYKAHCARNHKGECALLANNGDPVADLLYSNNWLPLGFAYAYFVTGEERFYEAWCSIASFLSLCQIRSDRVDIHGAWERAFDMDRGVGYGIPYDAGWGPYCIESGWTVGEILMGLQFMEIAEKRHPHPAKSRK